MFGDLKKKKKILQAIFSVASCLKSSLISVMINVDWLNWSVMYPVFLVYRDAQEEWGSWIGSKCLIYAEVPLNIYYLLSKVGEKHVNYMDVSDSRKGKDKYLCRHSVIFINHFLKHTPSFFRLISNFVRSFSIAKKLTCFYLTIDYLVIRNTSRPTLKVA